MTKKVGILEMINSKYPNYHPLMAIAELAHNLDSSITPELRLACHKEIARYIAPTMKSIEISSKDDRRLVTVSMFGDDEVVEIEPETIQDANLITVR